jgi:hypothetical protein
MNEDTFLAQDQAMAAIMRRIADTIRTALPEMAADYDRIAAQIEVMAIKHVSEKAA